VTSWISLHRPGCVLYLHALLWLVHTGVEVDDKMSPSTSTQCGRGFSQSALQSCCSPVIYIYIYIFILVHQYHHKVLQRCLITFISLYTGTTAKHIDRGNFEQTSYIKSEYIEIMAMYCKNHAYPLLSLCCSYTLHSLSDLNCSLLQQ